VWELFLILNYNVKREICFYIENKNLKERKGNQVNKLSDIVLVLLPRDILEILNQEKNISDEDFERISGENRKNKG